MAGPDLSLITNAPNLTDRIMQQQQYNAQLQSAQVDTRTKQNVYATQVMSAASASGDPVQYQKGKQLLASQGIDVSNWSDDPAVGAQQAQAARMSLVSPLGMLNSEIQLQRNGIQAAGVNSTIAPTGVPSLGMPISSGQSVPSSLPPSAPAANIPMFQQAAQGQASTQPPSLSSSIPAQNAVGQNPQPPNPSDTKYTQSGLNPKGQIELFKADLDAYNNRPDVLQAKKAAEAAGAVAGALPEKAAASQQGIDQVANNIEGMKALIPHLPEQGLILSAGAQADISNRLGANQNPNETTRNILNSLVGDNQAKSNAYKQFNLINEAQTINAIKELAATGQIRMTKQLTSIIERGFLVDPNASNTAKMNEANAVLAELKNAAINPQNVNAAINGGQQQPYIPVPTGIVNGSTATPQLGEDPITAELRKRGAIK